MKKNKCRRPSSNYCNMQIHFNSDSPSLFLTKTSCITKIWHLLWGIISGRQKKWMQWKHIHSPCPNVLQITNHYPVRLGCVMSPASSLSLGTDCCCYSENPNKKIREGNIQQRWNAVLLERFRAKHNLCVQDRHSTYLRHSSGEVQRGGSAL